MAKTKPLPCPFCETVPDGNFFMDQGFKWGGVECGACGARGPEVRTSYDESKNAPWHECAIKEWNNRL